jgi:dTDP-4-amino-4,6-dideoxygalactose transaminase
MKYIPYGKQHIDNKDKNLVLNSLSKNLITTGPLLKSLRKKLKNILNVNMLMYVVVEQQLFI